MSIKYKRLIVIFTFQMERDDAMTEVEILKEKLDKALYSTQKSIEEKETAHKEYEKMLEKYDRYILLLLSSCVGGDVVVVHTKIRFPFPILSIIFFTGLRTKSTGCRTR